VRSRFAGIWCANVNHLNILRYTKFSLPWPVWGTPGSGGQVGGVMLVLRTFHELVGRSVQNLVAIGPVGRAWKGDIGTNSHFYIYNGQPGPGAAREKFDELTLHKVFFPVTRLGFGVWGDPGSWGWAGGVMLVLRTFPELVGRSVQNLVEIGPVVRAWKGGIGTNSHLYIYIKIII